MGGDLAAEAGADDVYGGSVDGEGRRGEQLDQSEGILANETARDNFQDQISSFISRFQYFAFKTRHLKTNWTDI